VLRRPQLQRAGGARPGLRGVVSVCQSGSELYERFLIKAVV